MNHLHKITLTLLCLTILAFDKERLLFASFSIKSLFSLAIWTVPLEMLNLSTIALMLCPSSRRLMMVSFISDPPPSASSSQAPLLARTISAKERQMYLIQNCVTTPWPQVGVLSVLNGGVLLVERFEYR